MVTKKNSVGDFIADVMPKVKVYLFLSIVVILLNLSVVVVGALNYNSVNGYASLTGELPDNYKTMTKQERIDYFITLHKGEPTLSIDNLNIIHMLFPDGFSITYIDYQDFINGNATEDSYIDYSASSDTAFVTKTVGGIGTSFLPFASILVNVDFYANYFPISLIVLLTLTIISAVQLYVLFAMVLNHLPFFNI